jgi:ring-1,2-phenylacetyl-CoA epoxidase subunit PaaD
MIGVRTQTRRVSRLSAPRNASRKTADAVRAAVEAVPDPEYPGVGIGELGMVDSVTIEDDGGVEVVLVPTFLGCPALDLIEADARAAAGAVPGVGRVAVHWARDVMWSSVRIIGRARQFLADELTVAVPDVGGATICPVCGHEALEPVSDFGPSPCRRIARCPSCRNPVEVIRR